MSTTPNLIPFVTREFLDEEGRLAKGIFIDGKHFDWGIDEDSFKNAMEMGPKYFTTFQREIEKHFVESLSEFMGRRVTTTEVNEATKSGWIAK